MPQFGCNLSHLQTRDRYVNTLICKGLTHLEQTPEGISGGITSGVYLAVSGESDSQEKGEGHQARIMTFWHREISGLEHIGI